MKKRFFLSFISIAIVVLSASAQKQESPVVNTGNIEHIIIENDMSIILVPGEGTDRSISLNANAAEMIGVRLSNNSLKISALRKPLRKEKLTVYLRVNNLKTITVENNTTVKTIGVLKSPELKVFIDGEAMVHLKTNGDIKAYSLNDREIKIKYLSEDLLTKKALIGSK